MTLYTNTTVALPVQSIERRKYYCVAYDSDTNYIIVISVIDVMDETLLGEFDAPGPRMGRATCAAHTHTYIQAVCIKKRAHWIVNNLLAPLRPATPRRQGGM